MNSGLTARMPKRFSRSTTVFATGCCHTPTLLQTESRPRVTRQCAPWRSTFFKIPRSWTSKMSSCSGLQFSWLLSPMPAQLRDVCICLLERIGMTSGQERRRTGDRKLTERRHSTSCRCTFVQARFSPWDQSRNTATNMQMRLSSYVSTPDMTLLLRSTKMMAPPTITRRAYLRRFPSIGTIRQEYSRSARDMAIIPAWRRTASFQLRWWTPLTD